MDLYIYVCTMYMYMYLCIYESLVMNFNFIYVNYRRNYCATSKDIQRKLNELSAIGSEGILENEKRIWTRTAPADLYYVRDENNPKIMRSTAKLEELCAKFKKLLIDRAAAARALQVLSTIVNEIHNNTTEFLKYILCVCVCYAFKKCIAAL